jgi:hypothetical protein
VVQGSAIGGTQNNEHLSELREDHLRTLAKLVGVDYLRLNTPGALKAAMLDRRFAQHQAADTDLRWIPALLALLLLAWRFAPDLGLLRGRRLLRPPASRPGASGTARSATGQHFPRADRDETSSPKPIRRHLPLKG